MKILIPLTILVLSFIIYYFFSAGGETTTPTVTSVKNEILTSTIKEVVAPTPTHVSSLATFKASTASQEKESKSDTLLTLNDLREKNAKRNNTNKSDATVQKSYNQMIFYQLKNILQQASSTYYAKKRITLNSPISSVLSSQNAREKFKTSLSIDFGLDDETIREKLKQNRTVWDWVIFLSP